MKRGGFIQRNPKAKRIANPLKVGQTGRSAPDYKTISRDTGHMARVPGLGCLICGQPAQAHHVDVILPKGMGPKVTDYATAPLCERHHTGDQDDCAHVGEREFWRRHGIDIGAWIVRTLTKWYFGRNPDAQAAIDAIEAQKRKLAA